MVEKNNAEYLAIRSQNRFAHLRFNKIPCYLPLSVVGLLDST